MKNLGTYNENLDIPRKKDIDNKYGADNPPPYPVKSVNGATGQVWINANNVMSAIDSRWQGSGTNYYFDISCPHMTTQNAPMLIPQAVSMNPSQQKDWNKITKVESFNGYCRIYASSSFINSINVIVVY